MLWTGSPRGGLTRVAHPPGGNAVIIAGSDRVALDAVGVALLRSVRDYA